MAAADRRSRSRSLARTVAVGGLLSALALLFISISAFSPTLNLTLLTLASLCIAIAVMELGTREALIVYLAVSAIASAWPGMAFSYPFLTFFGVFPLLKAFAEKRWPRFPAAIFKLIVSAILLAVSVVVFIRPVVLSFLDRYGLLALIFLSILGLGLVLVYDYALSLLIVIFQRRRPSSH